MPKSHFEQDQELEKKQPIFATAEKKITRILNIQIDNGETAQIDKPWENVILNGSKLIDETGNDKIAIIHLLQG